MAKERASQQSLHRRVIRRWIVRAIVFLLLGAAVNVAVAWGCALFYSSEHLVPNSTAELFDGTHGLSDERKLQLARAALQGRSVQLTDIHGSRMGSGYFEVHVLYVSIGSPSNSQNEPAVTMQVWARQSGWPMPCLWSFCTSVGLDQVVLHSSFRAPDWISPTIDGSKVNRHLPTQPMWSSFAINTVLFGFILWLLFAAPFALRRWRRVRRGMCPKCAYPVGESDVCTECGRAVRRSAS